MDGVIIFADDDVLIDNRYENKLFKKFVKDGGFPVLPITNILDLEKAIDSISTFRVLILDWEFKKNIGIDEDAGARLPNDTPLDMLLKKDIYSLIYIYSRNPDKIRNNEELKVKFGDKIKIEDKKGDDGDVDKEFEKIQKGISDFEEKHLFMEIPFVWSQAINRSVQNIFFELEQADPNWIQEIKDASQKDGDGPILDIMNIFHNILSESLVQNNDLRKALIDYNPQDLNDNCDKEKTARLYRRIFYSKLTENAPIATGDLFKFGKDKYGILISPECEIKNKKDKELEFLLLCKKDIEIYFNERYSHKYKKDDFNDLKNKTKENLKKAYNNDFSGIHLLPSFPFCDSIYDRTACINFKTAFSIKKKKEFNGKRTKYRLNSPYIQQLRQRYIAFFGRYGVPDIPNSLRMYNLENIK